MKNHYVKYNAINNQTVCEKTRANYFTLKEIHSKTTTELSRRAYFRRAMLKLSLDKF